MFEKVGKWESWKESKDISPPPQSLQYRVGGNSILVARGGRTQEYDFLGKYIPLNYNVPFDLNLLVKE